MQQYTPRCTFHLIVTGLFLIFARQPVRGCSELLRDLFAEESGSQYFAFNIDPVPASGYFTYEVSKEGSAPLRSFSYNNGLLVGGTVNADGDVTNTADLTTGNVSFTLNDIQLGENGTYRLRTSSTNVQCRTLYVGGSLTISIERSKNTVKIQENIIFTCLGNSTAEPSGIPLSYNWRDNSGTQVPAGDPRITGNNGNIFTINSTQKEDEGEYTCTVVEDVDGGRTNSRTVDLVITGSTTTTATTAIITSPTTIMAASSTTATTTSSVPRTTTNISTRTTKMLVPSTVTASHTISSTVTSTKSTVQTPSISSSSVTPVADLESDRALVTMIIVVSVIGGVLIVAIFSIIIAMMLWKGCLSRRGHAKQYARRSDHRKQRRQVENNASGGFLTTRQDLAMRGYYFYNGTYKNPLFYDPFENSSYVNNYYPNQ